MLSIFSCAYWPSVCLLWRNVYLELLLIFQLGCLFFVIELYKLFVYFGNKALFRYMICKYFLPVWVYFWALYSVPLIHMFVFVPVPCCFDYCSFVVLFEVWRVMLPALFFFLRIALAILSLLWFHINFSIICSSSVKNAKSFDCFG